MLADQDADPDPEQLVADALSLSGATDALVNDDFAFGARIGARAVPLLIADGSRGIVGAHPPEAIRQLILGGDGSE